MSPGERGRPARLFRPLAEKFAAAGSSRRDADCGDRDGRAPNPLRTSEREAKGAQKVRCARIPALNRMPLPLYQKRA